MTRIRGICEGGPYHGKPIYHGTPIVRVAIENGKVITWFGRPTSTIKIGEYHHDGDLWIWNEGGRK